MMHDGMMLYEVICQVCLACSLFNNKLFLVGSVPEPIESHIPRFAAFLMNVVMRKVLSSGIISSDLCWWLRVAQSYQELSNRKGSSSIMK